MLALISTRGLARRYLLLNLGHEGGLVLEHEDSIQTQDRLRVFLQMNQMLISHVLAFGDQEFARLSVERAAAHAVDDKLHVAILATHKGIKRSLILLLMVINQVLLVLFAQRSYALLFTLVQTDSSSLHAQVFLHAGRLIAVP